MGFFRKQEIYSISIVIKFTDKITLMVFPMETEKMKYQVKKEVNSV